MNRIEPMNTRQISWENSINWKRPKPESDVLWADSNKQKLLLFKYSNKVKTESSQKSENMIHAFAPEVKEITLLERENMYASARESQGERAKKKPSNGRQKTNQTQNVATSGSPIEFENTEKCLYCNEKSPLGTDHNSWCRKLFTLNAMYTHYDLALHSRWTPPRGFPGKKQKLRKRPRKRSAKGDRRDHPTENKAESEPFSQNLQPHGIVSPDSEDDTEVKIGLYTYNGHDHGNVKEEYVLQSLLKSRGIKGRIPRSVPLPINFSRSNSPDPFPQCALCRLDSSMENNRTNASQEDVETRNDRKCEQGVHDPDTYKEVGSISGDSKIPDKNFHTTVPDCQRALPSPMTSPPPPTPETGSNCPLLSVEASEGSSSYYQTTVRETGKSRQTLRNMNNPESYMYPQPRWYLEIMEHATYGYGMFMPHPPLRRKEDVRMPSPGSEVVLDKLGLKFKIPHISRNVLRRPRKKAVDLKGFLGKQGGFLPPIGCREAMKYLNTLPQF